MRVAIIGCGSIGLRHAANAVADGHYVLLFDRDRAQLDAAEIALGRLGGWGESFLWPPTSLPIIEAAMICTPCHSHVDVSLDLLAGGYRGPLFVEKPISLSAGECATFEEWPHPTMMVGYNWRWNLEVRAWQQRWPMIPPAHLTFQCDTDLPSWPGRDYADPLLECSHELDLAAGMLGPTFVLLSTVKVGPHARQLVGKTPQTSVLIDIGWRAKPQRMFIARFGGQAVRLIPSQASIDQSYVDELKHFLACAEQQKRPDCTAADGVRVLDLLASVKAMVAA